MNILYIHQYFKTPEQPGGTRSYWIAKELIKNGHQVTMITSSSALEQKEDRVERVVDDIKIVYLKERYAQGMNLIERLKAFMGFVFKSTKEAFKQPDIDLVIATSTPLTIGIPALILKWVKGKPFVFEVRDLWPEVPIQMGAIKNSILIKAIRFFEKTIYKNAKHIVALSPGMQDGIVEYVPKEKTSMIPNMAKKDEFWPRDRNYELMAKHNLPKDSFKVIHFGALGLANGVQTVIESAQLIKEDVTVQFIFLGGGSMEDQLKKECKEKELNNVVFLPRVPMKETSEIVNFCDVSLVSFKDLPILYTNSPNKLFDSLSAGKPIIVNSAGWTKDLVEEQQCGVYVNPGRPTELIDAIKYLQSHPEKVKLMGEHSRKLAETKFDKTILCKKFAAIIEQQI